MSSVDIAYIVIVFGVALILWMLSTFSCNYLDKFIAKKYQGLKTHGVKVIKLLLNLVWFIGVGVMIAYRFFDFISFSLLGSILRLSIFTGVVSIIVVTIASYVNLWFQQKIREADIFSHDATYFRFLRYMSMILIYALGLVLVMFMIPSLRSIAATMLGGAGVIAIIAGVASQEAISNIVGGIFIILFKPFKVGDFIRVSDDMKGTVRDITLRHTVIKDFDNKMIVIPNSIINKEKIFNYDLIESLHCEFIEVGISYNSDIQKAKGILENVCASHPELHDSRTEFEKEQGVPLVKTAVIALADSSVQLRAWAWCTDYRKAFKMRFDILEQVKMAFEKEGVEIPYPHQTIYVRHDAKSSPTQENESSQLIPEPV